MRLKISTPKGGNKVINLSNDATFEDLIAEVKTTFGDISIGKVRYGYPLQTIDIEEQVGNILLMELGISSGERITVESKNSDKNTKHVGQTLPGSCILRNEKQGGPESLPDRISVRPGVLLQVHEVPDDNSCLFHAISYAVYKDMVVSYQFREVVANEILANPIEYSDSILGRPNLQYYEWILKSTSWGGAIEIAILSKYLKIAIFVLDIDAGRFEKFNEDKYSKLMILAFSGIHYDTVEIFHESSKEVETIFKVDDSETDTLLAKAAEVASKMKKAGLSFNTHKGHIKCNSCGVLLVGEREVAHHAESTGHVDFGQAPE
ncbi:ubiquitin-specific protease OTU1 Ecym_1530 [Eremothecium cymbalariae DBVPG|uniref:Ubiquitin thioesterase OTU n=1 Tax=Eremothecium cymbalariae (strain CBS 270.75 / DBVPG 7215 / KCTC 17166 / NRRL Y-17582) TaxID=931890 RepID=G8JMT5_ERECY|nr:hypothetical protein Ecym_1530 [Eremothecium cymbalariae DBVPG\